MNDITIPADARGLAQFCAELPDALPVGAWCKARDEARRIARHARHLAGVIEATRLPIPYGGFDTHAAAQLAFSRAKDGLRQIAAAGALMLREAA